MIGTWQYIYSGRLEKLSGNYLFVFDLRSESIYLTSFNYEVEESLSGLSNQFPVQDNVNKLEPTSFILQFIIISIKK